MFQGYLMKRKVRCSLGQSALTLVQARMAPSLVRRYFVLAPPFFLCYDSVAHAQGDFGRGRVIPHDANRAMRLASISMVRCVATDAPKLTCARMRV